MELPRPALSVRGPTVRFVLSNLHETLTEMLRHRPTLVVELLTDALDVAVPVHDGVRLEPAECVDLAPVEYRADAVIALTGPVGPVLAIVVEVQLRPAPAKRRSWPVYVTTLRARLDCPTALLVICVDEATAAWCAEPIDLGPGGSRIVPLVLGPVQVPVVTDHAEAARRPELAVMSAIAHGGEPAGRQVLEVLFGALATVDEDRALLYLDVVLGALPRAAFGYLEALMATRTYEYQSDFARRYFFEGKAEGKAELAASAVLSVLDTRGIDVPDDVRARITSCADLDDLTIWLRRAVTAGTAEDLFA